MPPWGSASSTILVCSQSALVVTVMCAPSARVALFWINLHTSAFNVPTTAKYVTLVGTASDALRAIS